MTKSIIRLMAGVALAASGASVNASEICRDYYEQLPDYVGGGMVYFRLCCDVQTLICRLDDGPIDYPEEP